jgi:thiosulfate/3-mercaptopyruvate sulfurtransferase
MDSQYCYLPPEQLTKLFQAAGVKDPYQDPVVFSCQRGITACIIELALRTLGNNNTRLYDGSLEEWARKTGMELPKEH